MRRRLQGWGYKEVFEFRVSSFKFLVLLGNLGGSLEEERMGYETQLRFRNARKVGNEQLET